MKKQQKWNENPNEKEMKGKKRNKKTISWRKKRKEEGNLALKGKEKEIHKKEKDRMKLVKDRKKRKIAKKKKMDNDWKVRREVRWKNEMCYKKEREN